MSATTNGFAAAVQPISQETIHTPNDGLIAGDVSIPVADGQIPAYRAMPQSGGPFPIVMVVQEIFGLHEYIKDVCRRIALQGYVAVAPALFARAGDPLHMTDFNQIRQECVMPTPDSQTMTDLDSTAAWAASESNGDSARVGITGFCWGGRTVWLYAAHSDTLKAGVAWYGRLAGDPTKNQPKAPIDVTASLKAPVLGLYGGDDGGIPMDVVERMQTALKSANSPSEIHVYPTAGHGFHADYRPSYNSEDARDGDRRMFEWFKKYGV